MEQSRIRDFEAEIAKVSKVAGAARAPRQLSLDDPVPGKVHGWAPFVIGDYGYRRPCLCGWPGVERTSKRASDIELRRHVAATPQGHALMSTLRRLGRSANGS